MTNWSVTVSAAAEASFKEFTLGRNYSSTYQQQASSSLHYLFSRSPKEAVKKVVQRAQI